MLGLLLLISATSITAFELSPREDGHVSHTTNSVFPSRTPNTETQQRADEGDKTSVPPEPVILIDGRLYAPPPVEESRSSPGDAAKHMRRIRPCVSTLGPACRVFTELQQATQTVDQRQKAKVRSDTAEEFHHLNQFAGVLKQMPYWLAFAQQLRRSHLESGKDDIGPSQLFRGMFNSIFSDFKGNNRTFSVSQAFGQARATTKHSTDSDSVDLEEAEYHLMDYLILEYETSQKFPRKAGPDVNIGWQTGLYVGQVHTLKRQTAEPETKLGGAVSVAGTSQTSVMDPNTGFRTPFVEPAAALASLEQAKTPESSQTSPEAKERVPADGPRVVPHGIGFWISSDSVEPKITIGEWCMGYRCGLGVSSYDFVPGFIEAQKNEDRKRSKAGLTRAGRQAGVHYVGSWRLDHFEGRGTWSRFKTSGEVETYSGAFHQSKRHGNGFYEYSDGSTYDGAWVHDSKTGELGEFRWLNGDSYAGGWRKNAWHGQGAWTLAPDGAGAGLNAKYIGDVRNGIIEGKGVFEYGDRSVYSGEFHKGKRHGRGKIQFLNGDGYVGEWRGDVYEGRGEFTHRDGNAWVGDWSKGQRHGTGVLTTSKGIQWWESYEDGVRKSIKRVHRSQTLPTIDKEAYERLFDAIRAQTETIQRRNSEDLSSNVEASSTPEHATDKLNVRVEDQSRSQEATPVSQTAEVRRRSLKPLSPKDKRGESPENEHSNEGDSSSATDKQNAAQAFVATQMPAGAASVLPLSMEDPSVQEAIKQAKKRMQEYHQNQQGGGGDRRDLNVRAGVEVRQFGQPQTNGLAAMNPQDKLQQERKAPVHPMSARTRSFLQKRLPGGIEKGLREPEEETRRKDLEDDEKESTEKLRKRPQTKGNVM